MQTPGPSTVPTLEALFALARFKPNRAQEDAICHVAGPLYLPAGPGSGKTRVLLWRTLNLIVCHGVAPGQIFLATFTEKAALQLREGLQALLGLATNHTGVNYDVGELYLGTIHSLCRRLIADRDLLPGRQRTRPPRLLDELDQYFHLAESRTWQDLLQAAGLDPASDAQAAAAAINAAFGVRSESKHLAAINCLALFNRLAEEQIDPAQARDRLHLDDDLRPYLEQHRIDREDLSTLLALAQAYHERLAADRITTFALLQQHAYETLLAAPAGRFQHVIIDEYQDTNTIQERILFRLAQGHGNLCVVGDDDQSLYRFRGATVENFVQFPQRCAEELGVRPRRITLATNYRSRQDIVAFYSDFMTRCDWQAAPGSHEHYRVADKRIVAHRQDPRPAVAATEPGHPDHIYPHIAALVRRLVDTGVVSDPNQVAFLFPSMQYRGQMNVQVRRMKQALEAVGFAVYAPRAGRFLDVSEARDMFGLFAHIFGLPDHNPDIRGQDYASFRAWLDEIKTQGKALIAADPFLAAFVRDRQAEIAALLADYQTLLAVTQRLGWSLDAPYDLAVMKRPLLAAPGLSSQARRNLSSTYFERPVLQRLAAGNPYPLRAILNRAASLDWSLLDLFYRLCGFRHFRAMFDLAEQGQDEGPICNLGLISQYLARFLESYVTVMTAYDFQEERFQNRFFGVYLFALYRLGESEYEDTQDPFPRGRIPFLTIHQSKGLEFPVVVLASPRKENRGPGAVELMVRPFLLRGQNEPLERMTEFDIMRMFYVALSRAENLLVLGHITGQGQRINAPFQARLQDGSFPRLPGLDTASIPAAHQDEDSLPRAYSFTADYLAYQRCPRRYMVFRKYGFAASRSQTMLFGSLVHRTLEDLHNLLITGRAAQP